MLIMPVPVVSDSVYRLRVDSAIAVHATLTQSLPQTLPLFRQTVKAERATRQRKVPQNNNSGSS